MHELYQESTFGDAIDKALQEAGTYRLKGWEMVKVKDLWPQRSLSQVVDTIMAWRGV